ncbi:HalOD1 output domain-containing protein [Haladaptatus sp.]|uniref:HalOD1 output domain-containing protein n=1 Tax=Haladaptatus sp. TaxID=1973141 RepID=UPI003C5AD3A1
MLKGTSDPVASAQYSWGGEMTLVQTIVETMSSVSGRSPEELPPLHHVVDVDALESVFGPRGNGQHRSVTGEISFMYEEYEVVVESQGRVLVHVAD